MKAAAVQLWTLLLLIVLFSLLFGFPFGYGLGFRSANFRKERLLKILETLSTRERRVLELRYGLGGQTPQTLDEVGRAFNVTRERIRQIEHQGLKKLRALADAQRVRDVA